MHQGGSGTTAQALRAGVPQLIVPFGWDQPDNAARVERMQAGLTLSRAAYTPDSAARALEELLANARYRAAAESAARQIRAEAAVTEACDAIEALLARRLSGSLAGMAESSGRRK